MIRSIQHLWWRLQRAHDVRILWPLCKEHADRDIDRAREVFFAYAIETPCWVRAFEGELYREILRLK